ncbi:nickel-type superoxide dismutase maturation protease [Pleurocapsa sp. PCC 7319]|uniref:nickel-type superoxide dismutase maturation protease n=1 Tax=Pleurocapsa sp. PCC 7319 TaxID=118161 RepID=UPI000373E894|nr:nickel-type superoxide dismutase maturation protease [Pleurocapsa sp. PCC 7319]
MAQMLPETNYRELLLWIFRCRKRLKVIGKSMLPLLEPGTEILINPNAYQKLMPKIGDIIVTTHPYHPELSIVKRITAINKDGSYFLTGDNLTESTDSRHWGSIKLEDIIGQVTSSFN